MPCFFIAGKDLNQRPPGYRSAPFAVSESRRAQFTAFFPPPFDRCSLILSLLPPPAAVEDQTQRAARRPHDPEPSPDNRFSQQKSKAPCGCLVFSLRGKDLNQRPPGYEPDELPAALPRDMLPLFQAAKRIIPR